MQKTNKNLILLNGLFLTSLLIANVLSAKIVTIAGAVIPAAVVAYPLTFLMTDLIGEVWGKEQANQAVKIGFICQLASLVMIGLAILLPVAPFADNQAEFKAVMSQSFRVVAASLVATIALNLGMYGYSISSEKLIMAGISGSVIMFRH